MKMKRELCKIDYVKSEKVKKEKKKNIKQNRAATKTPSHKMKL